MSLQVPAINPETGLPFEGAATPADAPPAYHLLRDVEVEITVEIGRRHMRIADVLKLTPGQTLSLSKSAGEPLDLYVNGRLLGRGEAVVVGDHYGVRITELISTDPGGRP
ncbi:MAG: flagellar motor switch protein FliN [Deltaproteobacteria bacterium]|nr:flagellar motor switch protein FliN [Myxococcales bacterium]MDP3220409.1 flagellar motor switch protein FliN [Deltaproteobacteria bacterium]